MLRPGRSTGRSATVRRSGVPSRTGRALAPTIHRAPSGSGRSARALTTRCAERLRESTQQRQAYGRQLRRMAAIVALRDPDDRHWVVRALSLPRPRSEEHTSELQSLMRSSYAVFCLKKKKTKPKYKTQ